MNPNNNEQEMVTFLNSGPDNSTLFQILWQQSLK